MKRIFPCAVIGLSILFSCERKDIPVVSTTHVTLISPSSAVINGKLLSYGECEIISKGFLLGKDGNPPMDTVLVEGNETGNFLYILTNLIPEQKYYFRAFASNCHGTGYGAYMTFTTDQASLPTVNTLNVYSITCTTATCGGEITDDGGVQVSDRGICWGTSENPSKNDNYISLENSYKLKLFSYTIKNLEINSPYYVRAYATNYAGTSYGESIPFSTKPANPDYDPHSIIGTWEYYYGGGGFAGCDSTIFGTTSIREFSIDSILINRFIGGSILLIFNDKFTISGNTIIHLNESGEDIFHEEFEINNSGDSLLIKDSVFRSYYSRLY